MMVEEAGTQLVLDVFRVNGALLAAGERIAHGEGLTAARWQVVGAIVLAGSGLTVPQIGRRMGLTRQSVQASVNRLVDDGLLVAEVNAEHRRSPRFRLTSRGDEVYGRLTNAQERWMAELAGGFAAADLARASTVLCALADRLAGAEDRTDGARGRRRVS